MATTSPLLALPAELRQEILIHVLAWPAHHTSGDRSHLSYAKKNGLYCGVCCLGYRKERYRGSENTSGAMLYRPRCGYKCMTRSMAILQTCRKIYFEGVDLLYKKTLFVARNQYVSRWGSERSTSNVRPWVDFRSWTYLGTTAECQNLLNRMKNVRVEQSIVVGRENRAAAGRVRIMRSLVGALGSSDLSLEMLLHFETQDLLGLTEHEAISNGPFDELVSSLKGIDRAGCRPHITIKTNYTNLVQGDAGPNDACFAEMVVMAFGCAGVPFTIVDNVTMKPR
ncbi:hypothetical protein CERZMDRAFT_84189 [Cercospora zeae-maydis SCOH1-5]|uniref:DUF7730 domain-containing protein n=1 Tax=Cercospora zeae-maydis SCOH1-5 TaxID=717836 RepID=A0A6A6FIT1_9PEZI|nr:hypothetical protein CERZMDRAFT_84189 [Cercospora zeae-maydis SCOH1-5]